MVVVGGGANGPLTGPKNGPGWAARPAVWTYNMHARWARVHSTAEMPGDPARLPTAIEVAVTGLRKLVK